MTIGFSVVIPAFNYGHCVERAVRSVLAQSSEIFEVLVINDGSSDNTDEVMQLLVQEGDDRLRYLSQPNRGLSAVRNRGVRESRYDWLVFLDADDEMCAEALTAYAECASAHPDARLLIGGHVSCRGKERSVIAPLKASPDRRANFINYLNKRLTISNGACAMHKEVFSSAHYDPELRHTEDIPVFAHVLSRYDAASFSGPVALIYKHSNSMRHDVDAALQVGMNLESCIFDNNDLPAWAESYRQKYRVRRLLSLLKICDRAGRYREVRRLFPLLFRASPLQALKPRYLRRYIRSLLKP